MSAINRVLNTLSFGLYNRTHESLPCLHKRYKAHKFEKRVIVEDAAKPAIRCERDLSDDEIISLFRERDRRSQEQGHTDPIRPQQYVEAFNGVKFYEGKKEISQAEFEQVEQMDRRHLISRERNDAAEINILRNRTGATGAIKYKIPGQVREVEKYIYPLDQIYASTVPKVLAIATITLTGSFVFWLAAKNAE